MKLHHHFRINPFTDRQIAMTGWVVLIASCLSSCGVYSFKDVSVQPPNAKTIHIGFIENKARYVNPQLSPQLTDQLKQKIGSRIGKLSQVPTADADFDVTAYVTGYDPSTSGVSGQVASTNRLTVTV